MDGHCDAAVRASTHRRDVASCSPDASVRGCCCYPGCDQGKCSSFRFERNIVFLPASSNSSFVGATWARGLDNFTFANNTYYSAHRPKGARPLQHPLMQQRARTSWGALRRVAAGRQGRRLGVDDPKFHSDARSFGSFSSPRLLAASCPST